MEIWPLISAFLKEFWELSLEMAPYLLLGFLFAGLLHGYFPSSKIKKYLGKNNLASVVNASLLGIPLPLCSCGVIPAGISFYKNGASKGSTVSFLISTPQTGVDSILVTYSLMGLPFAIIRPVIALITGVFGGWAASAGESREMEATAEETVERTEYTSAFTRLKGMMKYAFVDFMNDISKWLVFGLLLAALIAVLVPDSFFTDYLGNEYLSMMLVLLASVPMYVCATGSVPIAAVLIAKGLSPGAAIVFLMAGPATNVATMMVIGKSMGRKTLIRYIVSIIGGALIFGTLINEIPFIRQFFTGEMGSHGVMHSHFFPEWIKIFSAVLLGVLMINGYFVAHKKAKAKMQDSSTNDGKHITVSVNGMTCGHCKSSVETNVGKLEGISEVTADLSSKAVVIKGEHIDVDKVKSVINGLGYEYAGEK